jgi:hypothetical protein
VAGFTCICGLVYLTLVLVNMSHSFPSEINTGWPQKSHHIDEFLFIVYVTTLSVILYIYIYIYIYIYMYNGIDRLCDLVVRVSGCRSRDPGFDSRRYQISEK